MRIKKTLKKLLVLLMVTLLFTSSVSNSFAYAKGTESFSEEDSKVLETQAIETQKENFDDETEVLEKLEESKPSVLSKAPSVASTEIEWNNRGEFPYITEVSITDMNGKDISEETFNRDSNINIYFAFAIPNEEDLKTGDYFTIRIPNGFEIVESISPRQLDPDSDINMTWELTDNVITIKVIDLGNKSNVSGFMRIGCWFDKNSNIGKDGKPIEFLVNGNVYTVQVYYEEFDKTSNAEVTKKATFDKSKQEITWTIQVEPDRGSTLAGVKITDRFDSKYQEYVKNSCSNTNIVFEKDGFTYTFPDDTSVGTKTITYKTKILTAYYVDNIDTEKNLVASYLPNGDKSSEALAEVKATSDFIQKQMNLLILS